VDQPTVEGIHPMLDVIYLAFAIALFALGVLYATACDKL
jgi:hypothetical protein